MFRRDRHDIEIRRDLSQIQSYQCASLPGLIPLRQFLLSSPPRVDDLQRFALLRQAIQVDISRLAHR